MDEKITFRQKGIDSFYKIWHTTDRNMIIYVHSGKGSIVCNEKSYPIENGVLCFVGSRKYHYTMPDVTEIYERSKIFLSHENFSKMLSLLPEKFYFSKTFTTEALVYAKIAEHERAHVEKIFEETAYFADDEKYADALLLSSYLKLLIYLDKNRIESISQTEGFMYRAIEYINANITENIGIDGICAAVHVSKYHFCREFKKTTGLTVMDYILKTRIVLAKNELSKRDFSVGEISERCGFSSISYFCRVFKNDTGKTPLEFRKEAYCNIQEKEV